METEKTKSSAVAGASSLQLFAERYTAAWCSRDAASVAEFFAPDGWLTINGGNTSKGRGAITEAARKFMEDFPDLRVAMDRLGAEGDRFYFHWTLEGHNTGPGGSGRRVKISGYEAWKIGEDGLIEDSQGHFDAKEYQRQNEHGFGG